VDELLLDRVPDLVCGDVVFHGDVLKLTNDRAEDPGEDDALHALLGRVVDERGIREDMVSEVIVLQGEQNPIAPSGITYRARIQNS
jgi:hypothetical protein